MKTMKFGGCRDRHFLRLWNKVDVKSETYLVDVKIGTPRGH